MHPSSDDPRNVLNGCKLPGLTYCDQPYLIEPDDGSLLCVMTTGSGVEGEPGQHVAVFKSFDSGKTWSSPVPLEPVNGPESSYAVLLKSATGRLYCFYNYNAENIREVIPIGLDEVKNTPYRHDSIGYYNSIRQNVAPFENGKCTRVDTLGTFVFRYSDDNGDTWSAKRYTIPVREMEMDRNNVYKGAVRYFWNVGRPFIVDNEVFVPFIKVGDFGPGYMVSSEGVLLKSANLLSEREPGKAQWETLPEGDIGLRTPKGGGPIAEEHSFTVLSDGSFYCVYRSVDGYPVFAISRDKGKHWTEPAYLCYANGRKVKHPRAANFVWRCKNGKYLYWFHNQGGHFVRDDVETAYAHRNPVWLCGGVEIDTPNGKSIAWSPPDIILYDDDPLIRMSYPDLIEYRGKYLITETQKHLAHIHELDETLLKGLWRETASQEEKPILEAAGTHNVDMPTLKPFCTYNRKLIDYPRLNLNTGLTMDVNFKLLVPECNGILADTLLSDGRGFSLELIRNRLRLTMSDGRTECSWSSDSNIILQAGNYHATVIVDGGPSIIMFVINGLLSDGGEERQFGFGRFNPNLMDINGSKQLKFLTGLSGKVELNNFRLFDSALKVNEVVNMHELGLGGK